MAQTFSEIGVTGVHLQDGRSYDEYQVELRGERGLRTLRRMRDSDAITGAMISALEMLIRAAKYSVEPAEQTPEARDGASFLEDVLDSMDDYTFDDLLTEASSMFIYGYADQEINYKRRDDGNIGIKNLGIRVQETIDKYELDENNNVVGVWQSPDVGGYYFIPRWKLVHHQTSNERGNPYGRSILRSSYRSWYLKTEIEGIESLACERELNGLPIIRIPNSVFKAADDGDKDAQAVIEEYRKIARDVRLNSQAGVIIPSDPFQNQNSENLQYSNNRQVEIDLISSDGTRNIDTDSVIKRYASDQGRSILADWLLLGSDSRGSYALADSKSDVFTQALKAHTNRIVDTLNRQLVPKLWQVNGFPAETMPRMVVSEVAPMDLEMLGNYIKSISGAGILISDDESQNWIKNQAGIPTGETEQPDVSGRVENEDQE